MDVVQILVENSQLFNFQPRLLSVLIFNLNLAASGLQLSQFRSKSWAQAAVV